MYDRSRRLWLSWMLFLSFAFAAEAWGYEVATATRRNTYSIEGSACGAAGKSLIGIKHAPTDFDNFYTGLTKGTVAKWRYGETTPVWSTLIGSAGGTSLSGLAPSPDGSMVAVLSYPETIVLLDAATGEALPRQFANPGRNPAAIDTAISWSSYQNVIATGDTKGQIQLWQPDAPRPITTLSHDGEAIRSLAFTKSGKFLVAATKADVVLWNVEDGTIPFSLKTELGVDDLYINDAQLPEFNENVLTVTTYTESLVIDLSAQRILVRYPTPVAQQHTTGPFGISHGPFLSTLSPDLTEIVRIYKNPAIDRVDAESGMLQTLYLDPSLRPTMDQMPATVAAAIKPDDVKTVLVGVKRVDFGSGCISTTVDVIQYGL